MKGTMTENFFPSDTNKKKNTPLELQEFDGINFEELINDTSEFIGKKYGKTPKKSHIFGNSRRNIFQSNENIEEEDTIKNEPTNELNLKLTSLGISKYKKTFEKIDEIFSPPIENIIYEFNIPSESKINFKRARLMGKGPNGNLYESLDLITGEILAIKTVVQ